MSPTMIRDELAQQGIDLTLNADGSLHCHGPRAAVTAEVLATLRAHKPALVALLRAEAEAARIAREERLALQAESVPLPYVCARCGPCASYPCPRCGLGVTSLAYLERLKARQANAQAQQGLQTPPVTVQEPPEATQPPETGQESPSTPDSPTGAPEPSDELFTPLWDSVELSVELSAVESPTTKGAN